MDVLTPDLNKLICKFTILQKRQLLSNQTKEGWGLLQMCTRLIEIVAGVEYWYTFLAQLQFLL